MSPIRCSGRQHKEASVLLLSCTSLFLILLSTISLLAALYCVVRRRRVGAILLGFVGLLSILVFTLTVSAYQRVTSDEHPCIQADFSLTPGPNDCVQVVILESDYEGENGSHSYTLNITPVDNLMPYKMSHEYTRLNMPYSQATSETERMAGILRGMNPGNTTYIVNYFE